MTVEELMELKRKADAIAEIEKTVVKETNRYDLLLQNLKQILKFLKDTLINTEADRSVKLKLTVNDRYDTYVGIHENGEFYINFPDRSPCKINEDNFESFVICGKGTSKYIDSAFVRLADNWVRIKGEFLQGIKENLAEKIKRSQENITARIESYTTAKEFQV